MDSLSLRLQVANVSLSAQHGVRQEIGHIGWWSRPFATWQGRVESWVKDFNLSVADQRTLYLASADLLRSSRVLPRDCCTDLVAPQANSCLDVLGCPAEGCLTGPRSTLRVAQCPCMTGMSKGTFAHPGLELRAGESQSMCMTLP